MDRLWTLHNQYFFEFIGSMTLRYQPLGPERTSTFIDLKANPMVRGGRGLAGAIT